jgi:hypothetical protein
MARRPELMTPSELHAAASRRKLDAHRPTFDRIPGSLPTWTQPPTPDEGPIATPLAVKALAEAFAALGPYADSIKALVEEAHKAHLSFTLNGCNSQRRVAIGWGLVECWRTCVANDKALEPVDTRAHELVRAILAHVLDDDTIHQPAVPLGPALGALTCEQAAHFAQTAIAFAKCDVGVMFTTAGQMYFPTQPSQEL